MGESDGVLVGLCLESASESRDSVERWRLQVRTLERLPAHLADDLLRRLLRRRLVYPSLLEVFKHSVEEIDLRDQNLVDAEWMAYLGAFHCLRALNVADCNRINNSALWSIAGMSSLKELNLSRCQKVSNAGVGHLISIPTLEKLWIAETGITANGVKLLSSLTRLSVLDLGGLPVTDQSMVNLEVLTKLEYLDLWGSNITNKGAMVLKRFRCLSFLNLAWTSITKLPNLPSLTYLNMSNCTVDSIFEGGSENTPPLATLVLSGATFGDVVGAFVHVNLRFLSSLDVSNTVLDRFGFLQNMHSLENLDVSFSMMQDDSAELIANIGANMKVINFDSTKLTSAGVSILAGHVPNLEVISLSKTLISDVAISYLGMMSSLRVIKLSNTSIKGLIHGVRNDSEGLASLSALQSLNHLEILDLEGVQVTDDALIPLKCFQELRHLSLRSVSLTDASLWHLSSVPRLSELGIRDAMLTDGGLQSFSPPISLEIVDLRGCWLLTEDGVSLFCVKHPQIEVRHELVQIRSLVPTRSLQSSPEASLKVLQSKQRLKKLHGSENSDRNSILTDQRLKYRREELLAMNPSSSLFLTSPNNQEI